HLVAGEAGAEARALEAPPQDVLLADVAQTGEPRVRSPRAEPPEEAADCMCAAGRQDLDPLADEIATPSRRERFQRDAVADSFDEHDRPRLAALDVVRHPLREFSDLATLPLPRNLAHFNRRVTNRLTGHVASWAPGFAIVTHVGRRSGSVYRTPVNVFRDDGRYVFALTYGTESDWVRNVLAAGGCEIRTRRRSVKLTGPEVFT